MTCSMAWLTAVGTHKLCLVMTDGTCATGMGFTTEHTPYVVVPAFGVGVSKVLAFEASMDC